MLERFASLSPTWLRDAELSFSLHDPDRLGFQTRLDDEDDLRALVLELGMDPTPFLQSDRALREKFPVSPYRWIKIGFRGAEPMEASQYFLLDAASHYPISTLRVFARRFGQGYHPMLERFLEPALEAPETRWGLALKPGRASVFCHVLRPHLTTVLERMAAAGVADASMAARVLELTQALSGQPQVFLSLEPADPSRIAIDVEDPVTLGPVADWVKRLSAQPPRYLKCRPAPDGIHWTAYYPWVTLHARDDSEGSLSLIRAYYEETHEAYMTCLGPTLQAALIGDTPAESNLQLARRAGLESGMRVLDAGCGVCGPALDIATALDVSIDAVTLSPTQAETARQRVEAAGLGERVRVHLGDFHRLPFDDGAFDAVIMLESASYSWSPRGLFAEMARVLRPGGRLYIKDFFRRDDPLGAEEARELSEYDFTYRSHTRTLDEVLDAIDAAGFGERRASQLEDASMDLFHRAMVETPATSTVRSAFLTTVAPTPPLTAFGRWHRRAWQSLPVYAGEIVAQK